MANGRYIVNGSHEAAKLQELLDGFIRRFVLCPECENPETDLVSSSCHSHVCVSQYVSHVCTIFRVDKLGWGVCVCSLRR